MNKFETVKRNMHQDTRLLRDDELDAVSGAGRAETLASSLQKKAYDTVSGQIQKIG